MIKLELEVDNNKTEETKQKIMKVGCYTETMININFYIKEGTSEDIHKYVTDRIRGFHTALESFCENYELYEDREDNDIHFNVEGAYRGVLRLPSEETHYTADIYDDEETGKIPEDKHKELWNQIPAIRDC
jgi:hypothetical protein